MSRVAFVALCLGLAASCGGAPKPCPRGMSVDEARSQAGKSIWCRSDDGQLARWIELADGAKRQACSYTNGRPEGSFLAWHPNGRTWVEGTYQDGSKFGKWKQWDAEGALVAQGEYRRGEFVAGAPVGLVAACEQQKP